jgi:predicted Zn finger-like uncharacterized protein
MSQLENIYINISCPNCESQYAVDYMSSNTDGTPEYCPFCGDEIPENSDNGQEDDEEEQWS